MVAFSIWNCVFRKTLEIAFGNLLRRSQLSMHKRTQDIEPVIQVISLIGGDLGAEMQKAADIADICLCYSFQGGANI